MATVHSGDLRCGKRGEDGGCRKLRRGKTLSIKGRKDRKGKNSVDINLGNQLRKRSEK